MIRVLYAEDDPQVADVVRLYFGRHAAECVLDVVTSGRACLAAMQKGEYDVLLLDVLMPDGNGLQVLGELTVRHDTTPVIMVSGDGQHELAVRALRAGAVDCIDKSSAEFRRLPEIVLRVRERHPRRKVALEGPQPAHHRVLFVDPQPEERADAARALAPSAPRLQLVAEPTEALDSLARGETTFDAVVLGPGLESDAMLAALRKLRACDESLPVIVLSVVNNVESTVAAFKLGAHDYLLRDANSYTDLAISLHHALKQADVEKLNARLTDELANLNQSLAEQVAARTRDLQNEIFVRREAERRTEENAARLRALSTRLLRVQEDERHALAQELHDQIGQLLTGLRFQLESARQAAPHPAVDNALSVTDELLRSVRALTLQLRPRLLDDLGLRPALEWHANVFHNQTGITVDLELSLPAARFGPELELAVFRLVQEALTNVARHSGAAAASVTVTADDRVLHVEVSDRGRGFDTAQALARHDSLGLTGLTERVRLAGGTLEIVSVPGRGTRLHAEFALAAPALSP